MATEQIGSFDDLLALLERNPEYRARLRQLILDEEFQQLPAQVRALTEQMQELADQMRLVLSQLQDYGARLDYHGRRLDRLVEDEAERRFRQNAGAFFGEIARGIRALDRNELAIQVDDAIEEGRFNRADRRFVLALRGRDWDTNEERCLAIEVFAGVGQNDVERAKSRASLLEKLLGVPAIPVVSGYSIASEFQILADGQGVQVVITEESA